MGPPWGLVEAVLEFKPVPFRTPLKFGGRIIDRTETIEVQVTVETRDGQMANGAHIIIMCPEHQLSQTMINVAHH